MSTPRKFLQIGGVGATVTTGGGGGGGATPPGASGLTVNSAFFSQVTGIGSISVTSTNPGGTFKGVHFYLEIPDQSGAQVVDASSTLTGNDVLSAQWVYQDLGRQSFDATQQPWLLDLIVSTALDLTQDIPSRLYGVPYSDQVESRPIRHGFSGESPNVAFTAVSLGSGSPSAGTNVTGYTLASNVPVYFVASALAPDISSGKLRTPFEVIVGDTPDITGWAFQLVVTLGNADPTIPANQFVVSGVETDAGQVVAAADGIAAAHSFVLDTPTTVQTLIIWLQAGLQDATGTYQWNNIVPSITPSFGPIAYGSTIGTHDATAFMTATVTAAMGNLAGQFGVVPLGITTTLLGPLAVLAGNLAASAVDSTKLATGAVVPLSIQAAAVGIAAIGALAVDAARIVSGTITNLQVGSATLAGANIASGTISHLNVGSGEIQNVHIQNGTIDFTKITSVNAGAILAGTISVTISLTSPIINGGSITGVSLAISNLSGSGVATDFTQGFDSTTGINWGVNIKNSGGLANRILMNYEQFFIVDGSNVIRVVITNKLGNTLLRVGPSSGANVTCDGVAGRLDVTSPSGGTSVVALLHDGSNNGQVLINSTKVLGTRVATTPATLSDVISVLQHHGLSN